jgi:hypothetical protein
MEIECEQNDAPEFIEQIRACVEGVARLQRPSKLILVKINTWFGPKWLPFSAPTRDPEAGIQASHLSMPLFVPNRVISQRSFMGPDYIEEKTARSIHAAVRTSNARQRLVSDLPLGVAIVWYSGNSKHTGRGSLLVYQPMGNCYHPWYANWVGNGAWRLGLAKGTAVQDVVRFVKIGLSSK